MTIGGGQMGGEHLKSAMSGMEMGGKKAGVIAVASGKGGVGKTNISANLAVCFASAGKKVVLIDADFSLGNLDVVMGVESRYNVSHLIGGTKTIADVTSIGPCGVEMICGASGLENLAEVNDFHRQRLLGELERLGDEADIMIIDTAAGIGRGVTGFCMAADHVLVVTTPEPTAMTDGYAMIKVLVMRQFKGRISLVVNMAESAAEGKRVYHQMAKVFRQFLGTHVFDAGVLLRDEKLYAAVKRQTPVVLAYPKSQVTASLAAMASRLNKERLFDEGRSGFFKKVVNWFV
jgi:flagellar biosynthesis protein FlhG